jgi:hypothetical protein
MLDSTAEPLVPDKTRAWIAQFSSRVRMTGELCDEVSIGKMMNVIFLLMGSERQDRACAIGISHVVCNLTFLWVHPSSLPRDQPWRSGVCFMLSDKGLPCFL